MAFCLDIILLVVLVSNLQPLKGVPHLWSKHDDFVHKARGIVIPTKPNEARQLSSTFKFINQSDIDKGLDHLKKKYPNVDWSLLAPLPSSNSGKREFENKNSLTQARRTSSFVFINQSDIDKGLDHLKKKYPNVDWSLLAPLPSSNSGKREFENKNSLTQAKRASSFVFLNQSDIDKGLDHLKKKYPNVDWSFVTPLPSPNSGKRNQIKESAETDTNSYPNKRLYDEKKNFEILYSPRQEGNDIQEKQHESEASHAKAKHRFFSSFDFPEPEADTKGVGHLKEKYLDVDWTMFEDDNTIDA